MSTRLIAIAIIVAAVVIGGAIGAYATTSSTQEVEVRVVAKKLSDGRVEFAIQQRDGNGWSERIAPTGRYLPSDAPVGKWLASTAVTVTTEQATTTQPSTPAVEDLPFVGQGTTYNGFIYWAEDRGITGFQSGVELIGHTTDSTYDDARLWFACDRDGGMLWMGMFIGAWLSYSKEWIKGSLSDRTYIAEAKFSKTYGEGTWRTYGLIVHDEQVEIHNAKSFMAEAKNNRWLRVSVPQYDGTVIATFDLGGAFYTPVQRNLDECGNY